MDSSESVPVWIFLVVAVGAFSGVLSYEAAKSSVQQQAIAAKVGCWKVDENGKSVFSWDCPKGK